jgi:hypothetical protein
MLKRLSGSPKFEIFIAIAIAMVTATTAFVAWRANMVNSAAGDANRQGLIDAVKKQTGASEDWRRTYETAGYAQDYAAALAQVQAYMDSGDKIAQAQAANMIEFLLPGLQSLGDPLTTGEKYQKNDGNFDLDMFFADLEAASPNLANLDPQASFALSDRFALEQRWLTMGLVLLAISLFWLAISELNKNRSQVVAFLIGLGIYLFGLIWIVIVEIIFSIIRGGAA